MWAESRERGGHLGYDLIIWHLALWVHSHVQHLGLQPSGSLAALLTECLNWKSIHLLFSYWSVAAVYPSSLSAAEYCHWSGSNMASLNSALWAPSHKLPLFLHLCGNETSHTERTKRHHSSASTHLGAGSRLLRHASVHTECRGTGSHFLPSPRALQRLALSNETINGAALLPIPFCIHLLLNTVLH